MKKQFNTILICISFCVLIFISQSCERPGCTNSNARNFDPDATEDDGSCIIEGCTDYDAVNYNSNANYDDGSCYYPDGDAVFYTDEDYGHGYISVYVEGSYIGNISTFYPAERPDCFDNGCVTITRSPGEYSFHATAEDGWYWSGVFSIWSNDCAQLRLTGKKDSVNEYQKGYYVFKNEIYD